MMAQSEAGVGATTTSRRAGVLFDVDGTLIDTNYLMALAWSRALRDVGEWRPMNAVHRLVGMGGEQLVHTLFGRPIDAASERWRVRYEELADEARAFPLARELIEQIRSRGLAVALATSSPRDLLDRAIRLLGVDDSLDAVTSADDVEAAKPAPDVFETAMNKAGIDRSMAIAVGDSVWDVRAARAAGIACIAVETGGFSRHELREEGALAVYRDVAELHQQLATSPVAHLIR